MDAIRKLTEEQQGQIVDAAQGSGDGPERATRMLEDHGIDGNELDELMADWNYEMCPSCGWFQPTHEMVGDDSEPFENGACRECNDYDPDAEEDE